MPVAQPHVRSQSVLPSPMGSVVMCARNRNYVPSVTLSAVEPISWVVLALGEPRDRGGWSSSSHGHAGRGGEEENGWRGALHSSRLFTAPSSSQRRWPCALRPRSSRPAHARNSHASPSTSRSRGAAPTTAPRRRRTTATSSTRRGQAGGGNRVALHAQRFRPPYNSFFRHLPADSLELACPGGDPRCDTVSHCRAAAKDVGRTMMQRVESGEAARTTASSSASPWGSAGEGAAEFRMHLRILYKTELHINSTRPRHGKLRARVSAAASPGRSAVAAALYADVGPDAIEVLGDDPSRGEPGARSGAPAIEEGALARRRPGRGAGHPTVQVRVEGRRAVSARASRRRGRRRTRSPRSKRRRASAARTASSSSPAESRRCRRSS